MRSPLLRAYRQPPPFAGAAGGDARARTVYVGGLAAGVDELALRAAFAACGALRAVRLPAAAAAAAERFAVLEFEAPRRARARALRHAAGCHRRPAA